MRMIKLAPIVIHDSSTFYTYTPSGFPQVSSHSPLGFDFFACLLLTSSSSPSPSSSSCRGKYEFYGSHVCVVRRGEEEKWIPPLVAHQKRIAEYLQPLVDDDNERAPLKYFIFFTIQAVELFQSSDDVAHETFKYITPSLRLLPDCAERRTVK